MKLGFVFSVLVAGLVACGTSAPAKDASAPRQSCTSNVHCASDEVCFSYPVSGSWSPGDRGWREGFCEKLSK